MNSKTLENLKGRLEAWKGALESKKLGVNVKTRLMISKKTGKVLEEGEFLVLFAEIMLLLIEAMLESMEL